MELLKAHESFSMRLRRNRKSSAIRDLVRENRVSTCDLVVPFFVIEGENRKQEISSMPGIFRWTSDLLVEHVKQLYKRGIKAIAIFPVIENEKKNEQGTEALNPNGLIPSTVSMIKKAMPEICVICDVALDPYTSHGHDGLVDDNECIVNDPTIRVLGDMSLVLAESGTDIIAPSDMMDGRIVYIRRQLDEEGFQDVSLLSYAAKYASKLYGPFRDALCSHLQFGDKKTYQMDPANQKEALLEAYLDEKEGADLLMVKPATFYLDIIAKIKEQSKRPIAAYHVSGEYAMVMAAHQKGYLDGPAVLYESLLSIKRAGADVIFTYAVEEIWEFLDQ